MLSHIDEKGHAKMVDVFNKPDQKRIARARGVIFLSDKTRELIAQNQMKKGDVLSVSKIAGICAAKKTSDLIPLCHPLLLTHIDLELTLFEEGIEAKSEVACVGKTGVEMEALTAVSAALLTVYDMCKAVDKTMRIAQIELVEKVKSDV